MRMGMTYHSAQPLALTCPQVDVLEMHFAVLARKLVAVFATHDAEAYVLFALERLSLTALQSGNV